MVLACSLLRCSHACDAASSAAPTAASPDHSVQVDAEGLDADRGAAGALSPGSSQVRSRGQAAKAGTDLQSLEVLPQKV